MCLLFFCVLFHSVFFLYFTIILYFFLNAVRVDLDTSKEHSRYVIKGKSQNPSGGLANKQMQVNQSVGTCTKFIAHTNTVRVRGEEGFSPRRVHTLCWWSCVSPGFEQSFQASLEGATSMGIQYPEMCLQFSAFPIRLLF